MSYLESWDDYLESEETATLDTGGDTMSEKPHTYPIANTDHRWSRSYINPDIKPASLVLQDGEGKPVITLQQNGSILLNGHESEDDAAIVEALRTWVVDWSKRQGGNFR